MVTWRKGIVKLRKLSINLTNRHYDIVIGYGLLERLVELLAPLNLGQRVLIVTNSKVKQLYGIKLLHSLQQAGYRAMTVEVPDGEQAKTLAEAEKIYDLMFRHHFDRRCPVLALGGGVVGDLAGFVAATYMRGVPFIQLPTTLLAQVDSSVGGKVAVNHPRGKNIIGAFYQPQLVVTDTATLTTLSKRDLLSGLAETIKTAIIQDGALFTWLEQNKGPVLQLDATALGHLIEVCCSIKATVVEADEREQGIRAILNYGHTVGHALETLCGYGTYRHGEAVAIGMVVEAKIAEALQLISPQTVLKIERLIAALGLPTKLPRELTGEEIVAAMYSDKKVQGGKLTMALPTEIGHAVVHRNLPDRVVLEVLAAEG